MKEKVKLRRLTGFRNIKVDEKFVRSFPNFFPPISLACRKRVLDIGPIGYSSPISVQYPILSFSKHVLNELVECLNTPDNFKRPSHGPICNS